MWFKKATYVNPRPAMRLCYDCKYCAGRGKHDDEMIYCRYDDVDYFPETGVSCEDFTKNN